MSTYKPATFIRRLLAMLYDALLVAALLMVASAISLIFTGGETAGKLPIWAQALIAMWLLLVVFLYYGVSWTISGQTPGLRTWHMRALNPTGTTISWTQSMLRFLSALLGLGTILMLINKDKKALQDIVSKSIITDERKRGS